MEKIGSFGPIFYMVNLIITPDQETDNFPSRLILPFNNEEDIRLAMDTIIEITNAGVTFTTRLTENLMDEECKL